MKCQKCGKELNSLDKFCVACGEATTINDALDAKSGEQKVPNGNIFSSKMLIGIIFALLFLVQNQLILNEMRHIRRAVDDSPHPAEVSQEAPADAPPAGTSPHQFGDPTNTAWGNPMGAFVFEALQDPCASCNIGVIKEFCAKGKGRLALQELIKSLFHDGKDVKGVFAYFVDSCGVDILSPQAKAIYLKRHPEKAK